MTILEGNPVSPGFASGIAIVYDYEVERKLTLPDRDIQHTDVQTECDRIDDALEQSKRELKIAEQTASGDPKLADAAALLSAHAAMASEIAASVKQQIGCDLVNVEQALDSVIRDWISRLQKLDNEYLRQREQDVRDVGQRMTRNLAGMMPWSHESLPPGSVVVARELLPSEAVGLASSGVVAIVSEYGGKFSHTAIVARSLGIPAISGITNVTTRISSGAKLLVDGLSGVVTIQPTEAEEASIFSSTARKRAAHRITGVRRKTAVCDAGRSGDFAAGQRRIAGRTRSGRGTSLGRRRAVSHRIFVHRIAQASELRLAVESLWGDGKQVSRFADGDSDL